MKSDNAVRHLVNVTYSNKTLVMWTETTLWWIQWWDEFPNVNEMKWNESGFRPPLCTYRLNWARRTFWGWWDDWDDTVLQTQDSKFEPWRPEAEHATSRSRRLPTILTRGWGRNNFVSFKPPRPGTEPRTLAWKAAVLTTTLGPPYEMYEIITFDPTSSRRQLVAFQNKMDTFSIIMHQHTHSTKQMWGVVYVLKFT